MRDTHTHIQHSIYDNCREEYLRGLYAAGVDRIVIAGWDGYSSFLSEHIKKEYYGKSGFPDIKISAGLHPSYVAHGADTGFIKDIKADALGEIGLDFRKDQPEKELQLEYFERQLCLAKELKLPVIVHSVNACKATLDVLKRHPGVNGVIHGYSYSAEAAAEFTALGYRLGIGTILLDRRAVKIKRVVEKVPAKYLIPETDCPFGYGFKGQMITPIEHVRMLERINSIIEKETN